MSMQLAVRHEPGFLKVAATGKFSLAEARRTFLEVLDAVAQHQATKVLFDGRDLQGKAEFMERFFYGEFTARESLRLVTEHRAPKAPRFAYILKRPLRDPRRFGETVAANRGMSVKTFEDPEEAFAWLEIAPRGAAPTREREARSYRWVNVTLNAPFAARDGAGALVFLNKMWLLGGWNPNDKLHFPLTCNNEVWSSQDGAAWIPEKPNTFLSKEFDSQTDWEGRHTAGYVVFKDRMWIIGGDSNQGHYQNDVWSSADGRHWDRVSANVPWAPRCLHYTVVFLDRIWVMLGQTLPQFAPQTEVFHRDVWNSEDGVNWSKIVARAPWPPRGAIGGSVVFQNRIWILGGGTYDTPQTPVRKLYNDVWSSADGVDWARHRDAPWTGRMYQDVAVFDDAMWVLEGWEPQGRNHNDVWFSTDGETWQEVPETPWKPRHAASVFVYDDALWIVAGNNMQPDVWKLDRV